MVSDQETSFLTKLKIGDEDGKYLVFRINIRVV